MRKAVLSLLALLLATLPGCRKKETAPDPKQLIADLRGPDAEKSGRARLLLITLGEPAVPDLAAAVRALLPADLVFTNHVLLGGPVGAGSGAPFSVKAHGSELEYSMRGNHDLSAWGGDALAGARATFVVDKEGRIQHVEVGRTAIDPTGAYQVCDLLLKKKKG